MGKCRLSLCLLLLISLAQLTYIPCRLESKQRKILPLTSGETLVETQYDDVMVLVDSTDNSVSKDIIKYGVWSPKILRSLARFIKAGDNILNLGSQIGLEAVMMGRIAGEKGKLFVFEPYSKSHNILLKNIYINGLAQTSTIYNIGCSNIKKDQFLAVNLLNTGASTISDKEIQTNKYKSQEKIVTDRVDNVLPQNTKINFALIDVERLEIACLQGMKQTIQRSAPDIVLLVEWSGICPALTNVEEAKLQLLKWMIDLKYKFYILKDPKPASIHCDPLIFHQLSLQEVLAINWKTGKIKIADIWFIPEHIDPNTTF